MNDNVFIAFSTCPDETTAARIAATLVREGLAACVNRIPQIQSTYLWEGQLQQDSEVLLMIKTTAARLPDLERRLLALHPYELAELIAFPVTAGNERYLQWVRSGVQAPDSP